MNRAPTSYPSGLAGATLSKQEPLMRISRTIDTVCIELPFAEARVLFDELSHVRGGARLPKLRQVCRELEETFILETQAVEGRKRMRSP
jgi:hypothetical protein